MKLSLVKQFLIHWSTWYLHFHVFIRVKLYTQFLVVNSVGFIHQMGWGHMTSKYTCTLTCNLFHWQYLIITFEVWFVSSNLSVSKFFDQFKFHYTGGVILSMTKYWWCISTYPSLKILTPLLTKIEGGGGSKPK